MNPIKLTAAAAGVCGAVFAVSQRRASRGNCSGEADVLLVLGCRVRGDLPEPTLTLRAEAAAHYLLAHPKTLCIPCGGIVHCDQSKSEARAIFEILVSRGVDETRIVLEEDSKTTFENFLNAKKLLCALPSAPSKVVFLSSDFHLLRASIIAKLAGLPCETLAAPSPRNLQLKNYLREFLVFPLLLGEMKRKGRMNRDDRTTESL